jgi:hypothetical protein
VLVDRLMDWAWRTAGGIDWSAWRPDPADALLADWAPGTPPLTKSLVLDYARLHGWLAGRPLPLIDFDMLERHLAGRWRDAASRGDFSTVRDVIADVLLSSQVVLMPENVREAVRGALLWKHPAHAPAGPGSAPGPPPPPAAAPAAAQAPVAPSGSRSVARATIGVDPTADFMANIGRAQRLAGLGPVLGPYEGFS